MANDLYYGDNLSVMRESIASESVDLIYLDPPFNSQANYNVLFKGPSGKGADAQIEAFEDTWHWGEQAERAFAEVLASPATQAAELLRAMRSFLGEKRKSDLGYPTQKPVALLERIIRASSNEGDLVLDPFCGCGTTIHAAQKLGRAWIGIDITHLAISLIERRLKDAFPGVAFEVRGTPKDLESAIDLARRDKYQFQWWVVSLVDARPYGGKKKGADGGIDGILFFRSDKDKTEKVLISVKGGGNVGVGMVRDLIAVVEREKGGGRRLDHTGASHEGRWKMRRPPPVFSNRHSRACRKFRSSPSPNSSTASGHAFLASTPPRLSTLQPARAPGFKDACSSGTDEFGQRRRGRGARRQAASRRRCQQGSARLDASAKGDPIDVATAIAAPEPCRALCQ